MNNKKLTFAILTFAVVAALLTIYRNPAMMGMGVHSNMGMMATDPSTVSSSPMFRTNSMDYSQKQLSVPDMGMPRDVSFEVAPMIMPAPYYSEALALENRVYDQTAYQGLVVSNFSEYMNQVREYLQSNGGKILNISQYTADDMQYAYIDARIPAEKFDEATRLFSSRSKKVMSESINTQDVTAQQQSMGDQLVKLEEQKATKATELAAAPTEAQRQKIQTEIDQINMQIESLKTSQKRFSEQIKYATIGITISDSERFFSPQQGGSVSEVLREALRSLKRTATVLGMFLVWVAVYAVIWLPIVLLGRWVWNKMNSSSITRK